MAGNGHLLWGMSPTSIRGILGDGTFQHTAWLWPSFSEREEVFWDAKCDRSLSAREEARGCVW